MMNQMISNFWNQKSSPFFYEIFGRNASLHANFIRWTYGKKFNTVLEIGCGCGVYADILKEKQYHAIDVHENNVKYLDNMYRDAIYYLGDFMEFDFKDDAFELVFAHNVIEHINDPNFFLEKMIALSTQYIYLGIYTGVHRLIDDHEVTWKEDHFENKISVKQVEKILQKYHLKYTINSYRYLGEFSPGLIIRGEKIYENKN